MSPTIFKKDGYRFFFFSREEKRKHVHISSGEGEAKFWLEPKIELAKSYGYLAKHLKKMEKIIEEHYDEIIKTWEKHFDD